MKIVMEFIEFICQNMLIFSVFDTLSFLKSQTNFFVSELGEVVTDDISN